MSLVKAGFAALAGVVLWVSAGAAQPSSVVFSAREGGFTPVANLNSGGTADLKGLALTFGGGVATEVYGRFGLRGSFTYARSEYRVNRAGTGIHLNRWFYDGAVQFRLPSLGGLQPKVFGGAGIVVLDQPPGSGADQRKLAATAGLELGYQIPNTRLGVFADCRGWRYELNGLGTPFLAYDRVQYDVAWSGGLSIRFGR